MKTLVRIAFIIISVWMAGCSSGKAPVVRQEGAGQATEYHTARNSAIPKAVIYRTNGDYADNVPVNLNESRTSLVSYPAPSDITSHSAPVPLGDGWLFDRRGGVGINTVFLNYTYSQYAALKYTPSSTQLMQAIIPGSGVTQSILTPVTLSKALADPDILKQYIPQTSNKN